MLKAARARQLLKRFVLVVGLFLIASHGAVALHIAEGIAVDVRAEWPVSIEGKEMRLRASVPVRGPVTMGTQFTVHDMGRGRAPERIVLAELRQPGADGGEELALVWAPSPSDWFGTLWSLQLHSPDGLEQRGRKTPFVELAMVNPEAGHRYEALISLDEEGTSLALSIVDRSVGKSLYRGVVQLAGVTGDLVPAVGSTGPAGMAFGAGKWPEDAPVSFDIVSLVQAWLPVGAQLDVGAFTPSGQVAPVQRFDLGDSVGVGLSSVGRGEAWRLTFIDVYGTGTLLAHDELLATGRMEIPAAALPIGSGRLRLEYLGSDREVLLVGERDLAIGTVRYHFSELVADKERGELRGEVTVSSIDGPMELGVRVEGILERAIWSADSREYVTEERDRVVLLDEVVALDPAGRQLQFSMPLPEATGAWCLRLEPGTDVGTGIDSLGIMERWFTTYPSAEIEPGEAFIVAILPDTQLYTWSHPHIFTRQTEWLAEQAATRNIGMVLHLGDVTEKNERWEWERADQSLGMLDGVIPYTVTVGNHDIIDGDYSVYNRQATLLNAFFPPERFAHLSGTFESGHVENSYHLVTLGDTEYLFLMLEYAPRDEVLTWAGEVLAAHPDHKAIVVTHTYLAGNGSARISPYSSSDYPQRSPLASVEGESVNDGEQIWEKLIRWHPNVLMVWSGHIPTTTIRHRMSAGAAFNPVYELLADFQAEPLGGSGWLVLLEFSPNGKVSARTYSPYLDAYNTAVDQYGFTNHIIIDVNTGRVQRLSE